MAGWLREFRFAPRLLRKNRGVSAVAFVTPPVVQGWPF